MLGAFKAQDVGFTYSGAPILAWGGYLYRFGGPSTSGAQLSTDLWIQSSKILEDGSLAPAKIVGSTPQARAASGLFLLNNMVLLVGGSSAGSANFVTRYILGAGGTISEPFVCEPMNTAMSYLTTRSIQIGDMALFWRPTFGALSEALWAATITSMGLQNWRLITPTPIASLSSVTLVAHKGNVLSIGGFNAGNVQTPIYACKISLTSATPWRRVGDLPIGLDSGAALVIDGRLVIIGGRQATSGTDRANPKIYMAKLDGDANLVSPFSEVSTLVTPSYWRGTPAFTKSHVYVVGGTAADGVAQLNTVQYAPIIRGL